MTGWQPHIYQQCVTAGYPIKYVFSPGGEEKEQTVTIMDYMQWEMLRTSVLDRTVEEIKTFHALLALIGATHTVDDMWLTSPEARIAPFRLEWMFCPVRGPCQVPDDKKRKAFIDIIQLMICMEWFHVKNPKEHRIAVSGQGMSLMFNVAKITLPIIRRKVITDNLTSLSDSTALMNTLLEYDLVCFTPCMEFIEPITPVSRHDPW
jgi:hypothetical protein